MSRENRVVETIKRAIEWFDFDEPGDTALSLAKVILANLRAKDFDIVQRGLSPNDICVIHLAPRAVEEDPNVCWEYDGINDCRFSGVHLATESAT